MRLYTLLLSLLLLQCNSSGSDLNPYAKNNSSFRLELKSAKQVNRLLEDKVVKGIYADLAPSTIDSIAALQFNSTAQRASVLVDLRQLFGFDFNLTKSKYLTFSLFIPKETTMYVLKVRFRDLAGNMVQLKDFQAKEIAVHGEWKEYIIDLDEVQQAYRYNQPALDRMENARHLEFAPVSGNGSLLSFHLHGIKLGYQLPLSTLDE